MTLASDAKDRSGFVGALGWILGIRRGWLSERGEKAFATLDAGRRDEAIVTAAFVKSAAASARRSGSRRGPATASAKAKESLAEAPSARRRKAEPLSHASQREQTAPASMRWRPQNSSGLSRLNAAYREKFGFPFGYA